MCGAEGSYCGDPRIHPRHCATAPLDAMSAQTSSHTTSQQNSSMSQTASQQSTLLQPGEASSALATTGHAARHERLLGALIIPCVNAAVGVIHTHQVTALDILAAWRFVPAGTATRAGLTRREAARTPTAGTLWPRGWRTPGPTGFRSRMGRWYRLFRNRFRRCSLGMCWH